MKHLRFSISGIICESEPYQKSLINGRSQESLDSGKNDQSEGEECIEILETKSMDEEYAILQSENKVSSSTSKSDQSDHSTGSKEIPNISQEQHLATTEPDAVQEVSEPLKFKSYFLKNAIFRTAQSIIENHEKKNTKFAEPTTSQLNKKRDPKTRRNNHPITTSASADISNIKEKIPTVNKSFSTSSLSSMKAPGGAQCMKELQPMQIKTERGQSGLLRFFESPVFNIHFAVHYLFYSKEPGVLSFIGNKIFSFSNSEVDLYIPQLILMYIQIDELADVLDPYLVYRCRQSADFSLKCSWLLEAYNFNTVSFVSTTQKFKHLSLMKELYPKRERKSRYNDTTLLSPISAFKKTHYRSQSDATGMLNNFKKQTLPPVKLCLGDLSSGRAFDNGCICFMSQRGTVNDLLGQETLCSCGAPKLASEKEFLKSLIDIGKMLTLLPTKIEKTSRLRVLLNLINKNLPARVWLPLNSETPHHVVRITEDKTAVLNSKDKTPYIIYVEVVEVSDIYTSPVIPKMMPTLRRTKSDEHLDQSVEQNDDKDEKEGDFALGSHLVFNEDEVWSKEDDEITAQYIRMQRRIDRDNISQLSIESCDSTSKEIGKHHDLFRLVIIEINCRFSIRRHSCFQYR
jgi:phosphatidylinositol 4-kinase B